MSREYNAANENPEFGTGGRTAEIKERAADLSSKVKDKASQVSTTVSQTMDRRRESAATGLNRVAGSIHDRAGSVPGGPRVERIAHGLANGMESTASYLRDHNFSDMKHDVVEVARKHPAQALLSALIVGFFVGRAVRR